jgi:FHS family glucose/mannose:H+ symporter-like MFS transporter
LQRHDLQSDLSNNGRAVVLRSLVPLYFYFVVAGIVTVMLGPLLPVFIQQWNIQDAQAGTLFVVNFAGQLCGALFAARNLRLSVILGALFSAVGCAFMAWASFSTAPFALFFVGAGIGIGLTAGNIIAGTAVPALRGRLLAIVNVAWGIGAISCPLLLHAFGSINVRPFLLITSAVLLASALFTIVLPPAINAASHLNPRQPKERRLPLPMPLLFFFTLSMLLYIGIENSLGGWLPSYAVRIDPAIQASTITLYFWIAELIGRLLIAALVTRWGEPLLYRICLVFLLITTVLFCTLVYPSSGSLITLTFFSAFTLAPLYPLMISLLLARTGTHPQLGLLFSVTSLGGASLPWLTGVLSTRFHHLRAGLVVPAIAVLVLLSISGAITRKPLPSNET